MPRNGDGTYSLPANYLAIDQEQATAAQHNDPLEDLENLLSAAMPVNAGGTGARTAAAARTNLGMVIGTDIQAQNATLQGIADLGGLASDRLLYTTALNTFAGTTITAAGRAILDDADAAAQRTTLGLGTASVADLIDEDDMASDDATAVPSQQSVKAYVDANSGGGLVLLDSGTVSDDANVDITWTNDGTYDGYIIEISQFVPVTDNVYIYCRTTSDGTNFDSGASDYNYFMGISGGAAALAGAAAAQGLMSWADTGSDTNEIGVTMTAKVMHPEDTTYTMITATGAAVNSSGTVQALNGAIIRSSAAACRGIRLFASSGNIESGKWRLYGLES
jgi:hypothetical protein